MIRQKLKYLCADENVVDMHPGELGLAGGLRTVHAKKTTQLPGLLHLKFGV
jgi:hypothetical protein